MSHETDRAVHLKKSLLANKISPDDFLQEGYPAIAIHSNSTIFACNEELADITGYTVEELEGMNAWKLFPSESATVLMENLQSKSEEPYQVKSKRKDGTLIDIELKAINFEISGEHARAVLIQKI